MEATESSQKSSLNKNSRRGRPLQASASPGLLLATIGEGQPVRRRKGWYLNHGSSAVVESRGPGWLPACRAHRHRGHHRHPHRDLGPLPGDRARSRHAEGECGNGRRLAQSGAAAGNSGQPEPLRGHRRRGHALPHRQLRRHDLGRRRYHCSGPCSLPGGRDQSVGAPAIFNYLGAATPAATHTITHPANSRTITVTVSSTGRISIP